MVDKLVKYIRVVLRIWGGPILMKGSLDYCIEFFLDVYGRVDLCMFWVPVLFAGVIFVLSVYLLYNFIAAVWCCSVDSRCDFVAIILREPTS